MQPVVTAAIANAAAPDVEESDAPPEGFRANVGVCLVNKDNKVFVASRLDRPDAWQMPQGGIDEGETPAVAALRELREETGVRSAEVLGEVPKWLTYEFPPNVRATIAKSWGRDWKGQAQKWFLFRLTGDESEIDLLGDGTEKPEFGSYKWIPISELPGQAVEFKRKVYDEVAATFAPLLERAS